MKQKARKMRLVSTYWIKDPILFAQDFSPRLAVQQHCGMQMTRLKVKEHRRRNPEYPYRVTVTSQVLDKSSAIQCMQQNMPIGKQAGVQMSSIDNAWFA
jgi:hypothetical protein